MRALLLCAALSAIGCGGSVEVVRAVSPAEARESGLEATAIVRPTGRVPLPQGARVERGRVVVPEAVKLGPDDVVEQDERGTIVAVRRSGGEVVRFEPGTATMSAVADEVRGELDAGRSRIKLERDDRIEVKGMFDADETIPGGGRVERSRPAGFLFGGATILLMAYAPSAYIGAISRREGDRVLLVPIAGPFLDLANRPDCKPPPGSELIPVDPCVEEKATRAALIASGALQSLGGLLFAIGLPARTKVVPADQRSRAAAPILHVVPTRGGASVLGTF